VAVLIVTAGFLVFRATSSSTSTTSPSASSTSTRTTASPKPIILYINQGNGAVNQTNFGAMLSFSLSHGFNTIFFQVYRGGTLLFQAAQLSSFVAQAHGEGLKIFFALYFTNSSQQAPATVFPLGEDGVSLDMSTLPLPAQASLLATVKQGLQAGQVAITTTDFSLPLKPDLLVLETYGTEYQSYIHPGVVGSVGVFATSSKSDYEQQVQYALQNGDGVMVFDYAGLMKSGY
jgi:hypothetical protein